MGGAIDGAAGAAPICRAIVAAESIAKASGGRPTPAGGRVIPFGAAGAVSPRSKIGNPAIRTIVPMLKPPKPGQKVLFPPPPQGRPRASGRFVPPMTPWVKTRTPPAATIKAPSMTLASCTSRPDPSSLSNNLRNRLPGESPLGLLPA